MIALRWDSRSRVPMLVCIRDPADSGVAPIFTNSSLSAARLSAETSCVCAACIRCCSCRQVASADFSDICMSCL